MLKGYYKISSNVFEKELFSEQLIKKNGLINLDQKHQPQTLHHPQKHYNDSPLIKLKYLLLNSSNNIFKKYSIDLQQEYNIKHFLLCFDKAT